MGWLVAVLVALLALVALVRFVNHRRALKRWLQAPPTSEKRRIEQ